MEGRKLFNTDMLDLVERTKADFKNWFYSGGSMGSGELRATGCGCGALCCSVLGVLCLSDWLTV